VADGSILLYPAFEIFACSAFWCQNLPPGNEKIKGVKKAHASVLLRLHAADKNNRKIPIPCKAKNNKKALTKKVKKAIL